MCARVYTPVTLCREQSIRGYVSKERSNVNVGWEGVLMNVCVTRATFTTYNTSYLTNMNMNINRYKHLIPY